MLKDASANGVLPSTLVMFADSDNDCRLLHVTVPRKNHNFNDRAGMDGFQVKVQSADRGVWNICSKYVCMIENPTTSTKVLRERC